MNCLKVMNCADVQAIRRQRKEKEMESQYYCLVVQVFKQKDLFNFEFCHVEDKNAIVANVLSVDVKTTYCRTLKEVDECIDFLKKNQMPFVEQAKRIYHEDFNIIPMLKYDFATISKNMFYVNKSVFVYYDVKSNKIKEEIENNKTRHNYSFVQ